MLNRKLLRDIRSNWGGYLACVSTIFVGLMMYVSFALTVDSLENSRQNYYRDYGFADGFARIARGPQSLLEDFRGLPGVDQVTGRVVQNVMVHKPAEVESTTVTLISFERQRESLNRFKIEQGKLPAIGERELLISMNFANANGYKIGDRIPLIIGGRKIEFKITGTAVSPEYVYEYPPGLLVPDPRIFGVAYLPYASLAPLLGMDGQINDVVFTLKQGTAYAQVERQINKFLTSYGLMELYPRNNQLSHAMLDQEIKRVRNMVYTVPSMFLIVAAGILYFMLRRLVEQQRSQLGVLKAFGYHNWQIICHYLSYAALIGVAGGLLGSLAGASLTYWIAAEYQKICYIPGLTGSFAPVYLITAIALSVGYSLIGGYMGCRGVLVLSPAEAMQAPAPQAGRRILLERMACLWQALSSQGKMAVRNIFRAKQRSILAVLGIAFSFSMMVAMGACFDSIYHSINFQYEHMDRYDLKISLRKHALKTDIARAALPLREVKKAEPLLEVPVTLSHKWLEKDIKIAGLPAQGTLYRLMSAKKEAVELPAKGLVISEHLSQKMKIGAGDTVTVKPYQGAREKRQVKVQKVVPLYIGLGAYMEIGALSEMLKVPPVASAMVANVNINEMKEIRKKLREGKNIAFIIEKSSAKAQLLKFFDGMKIWLYIMWAFAFVLGFAIVYNLNVISLSERAREMATLKIVGMTDREIARVLQFEQGLLGVAAVIIGIPLSYMMSIGYVKTLGNELYSPLFLVTPGSYMIGLIGTLAFLAAAQGKMKSKINTLSMLEVLKQQS